MISGNSHQHSLPLHSFVFCRVLANIYQVECTVAAINCFILYIQFFKYAGSHKGVTRIMTVLKMSVPDVAGEISLGSRACMLSCLHLRLLVCYSLLGHFRDRSIRDGPVWLAAVRALRLHHKAYSLRMRRPGSGRQ